LAPQAAREVAAALRTPLDIVMHDADDTALDGEPVPFGHPYTHAYRLHRGGRGFVALCRKPGTNGRAMDQRCYDVGELFDHLPAAGADGDCFISVNTFKRPNRTAANLLGLRACFIDVDCQRLPVWANVSAEDVLSEIFATLTRRSIPHPTMVIATGAGLHLYWTFPKSLPKGVVPRWSAVQSQLCYALKVFGADSNAIDVARVLRLAGTTNTKVGIVARIIHLDLDRDVDFGDLASAVLPLTQHALQVLRRARAEKNKKRSADRSACGKLGYRTFVETLIADIDRLIAYRWNGRIPENHRNTTLFVRGCFLVRRVGVDAIEAALLAYGCAVCDLDPEEMVQIAGSIAKKIIGDGHGYRYSVVGAAAALGVTVEEVYAAGLVRLHPADPELAGARRQARLAVDRERKAVARRAQGVRARSESLARTQPWRAMRMCRSTWFAKGKPMPSK
jgi:hypothetical protein